MNRIIKFRAWDKRFKKMDYGGGDLLLRINEKDFSEPMQYTGLKDETGVKKIYEGDIIKCFATDDHKDRNKDGLKVVVWDYINAKWGLHEISDVKSLIANGENVLQSGAYTGILSFDWGGWWKYKIIGDYYENPELLI